jgi:hypothetical protein
MRIEPVVSVPSASAHKSATTAAADPLEDPPGFRSKAHGFRTDLIVLDLSNDPHQRLDAMLP